jgi:hypothetical protein
MIKGPTVDHEGAGRGEEGAGKCFFASSLLFSNSLSRHARHPLGRDLDVALLIAIRSGRPRDKGRTPRPCELANSCHNPQISRTEKGPL